MTPAAGPLRVSLTAPQFSSTFDPLLSAAEAVDRLGFDGLFLFDHLVPLGDPRRPVLELAAALGALAPRTRSRIGTLVMRAPLRGVAVSAAIAASTALLAPGRFVLGIGGGDRLSAEEARRFGHPTGTLQDRLRQVAETVEAVRAMVDVPVWVGGRHPRLLDLVASHADGWNAWGIEPDELARVALRLRQASPQVTISWGGTVLLGETAREAAELAAARGGSDGVIPGDPETVAKALSEMVESGASELVVAVLPNREERWRLFAETVLPRLREVGR